jgi:hypothetical protein
MELQFLKIITIYGTHIENIYEQTHPSNNVSQELLKHIGLTTSQYILHSNCQIIFHNKLNNIDTL